MNTPQDRAWRLARLAVGLMRQDRIESDALAAAEKLVKLAALRIDELDRAANAGAVLAGCTCAGCNAARQALGAL